VRRRPVVRRRSGLNKAGTPRGSRGRSGAATWSRGLSRGRRGRRLGRRMRRRASLTLRRSLVRNSQRSSKLQGRTTVGCPRRMLTASRPGLGFGLYSPRGHLPGRRRQLVEGTRAGRWGVLKSVGAQRCRAHRGVGSMGTSLYLGTPARPDWVHGRPLGVRVAVGRGILPPCD
jgi:hypothetical protein